MKKLIVAVMLIITVDAAIAQPVLSFPCEFIDFTLDDNYFTTNGIYRFSNNSDHSVNTTILFPFPVNTSFIDSIHIMNLENAEKIVYKKRKQDIVFSLHLLPKDTVNINIIYRQPASRVNIYRLSTTQYWGSPLKSAAYTLTTNKDQRILSFSIEPDSSVTGSEKKVYYWNKADFYPQTDFEIMIDL